MTNLVRKYPEVLNPCCSSDGPTTKEACLALKSYIENPLKLFLLTEGPDKDPTWLQTLPNEAMKMVMDHCVQLAQGYYKPEIGGALNQPKFEMYSLEQFHKGSRVAKRFFEFFSDRVRFHLDKESHTDQQCCNS